MKLKITILYNSCLTSQLVDHNNHSIFSFRNFRFHLLILNSASSITLEQQCSTLISLKVLTVTESATKANTQEFSVRHFLRVRVRCRSSGSSLSPCESAGTQHACMHTQWTPVKVLPSLSNNSAVPVYPPRVLRLRTASSSASLAPFPSTAGRPHCLPRVVTYTIVQRANIDKSVGAKTSEGLVPPVALGCPSSYTHVFLVHCGDLVTHTHVHRVCNNVLTFSSIYS